MIAEEIVVIDKIGFLRRRILGTHERGIASLQPVDVEFSGHGRARDVAGKQAMPRRPQSFFPRFGIDDALGGIAEAEGNAPIRLAMNDQRRS
jgi:hypothetical protein